MKVLTMLLVVVTLVGCVSQAMWRKDGVSRDATTTDFSECRYQVGISKAPSSAQQGLINDCMQGKGYRYR